MTFTLQVFPPQSKNGVCSSIKESDIKNNLDGLSLTEVPISLWLSSPNPPTPAWDQSACQINGSKDKYNLIMLWMRQLATISQKAIQIPRVPSNFLQHTNRRQCNMPNCQPYN